MIDPIGDYGIGTYTHELAEGLAANDVAVSVYTNGLSQIQELKLPRRHRLLPVLGSVLFRQRHMFAASSNFLAKMPPPITTERAPTAVTLPGLRGKTFRPLRDFLLPLELALHLRQQGYDLIWTQWPAREFGKRFWRACHALGLRLAHTVHNLLPHEESPDDRAFCQTIYEKSDYLFVHSNEVLNELTAWLPSVAKKAFVSPIGTYTIYPRTPDARGRIREQLAIKDGQPVLLFFGSIRPYKNIDAALEAMTQLQEMVMIVCGTEFGYSDSVPGDALGRTRRLAETLGIAHRVRFIPKRLDLQQTAELFEASDIVLLPYSETYGSGVLLLAMTFEKFVVVTAAGGTSEYMSQYPRGILITGCDSASVAQGVTAANERTRHKLPAAHLEHFRWPEIARKALIVLEQTGRLA